MSPRRKLDADAVSFGEEKTVVARDRWAWVRGIRGLPGLSIVASLLVAAVITVSGWLMWWPHWHDQQHAAQDADVLGVVGHFMTDYTSLDPFHANDYADRILGNATGDFAKEFKGRENAILIQVARAEPSKGAVLEAGIEEWHDDGSVSVLVATKMTTTVGKEKKPVDSGNRWVVTAVKEGQQWKISQLTQVI